MRVEAAAAGAYGLLRPSLLPLPKGCCGRGSREWGVQYGQSGREYRLDRALRAATASSVLTERALIAPTAEAVWSKEHTLGEHRERQQQQRTQERALAQTER